MRCRLLIIPVAIAIVLALAACGGGGADEATKTPADNGSSTRSGQQVSDLAKAVVQLQALDGSGSTIWTGSGTFISEDGLILTNGHVVDDRFGEYADLGVAITNKTDEPAELKYIAKIEAVDYALDLAVVRVDTDLDGKRVSEKFPFIPVGDSDAVEIGDNVRILGYPGIGGETITFTNGVVSGFNSERSVGERAWIKTDATIAGGNSGGLAVDEGGRLIGVPTIAGSGADSGESVDCRLISDTNRDGRIDDNDTCVPVGGFINGLRPVNLAQPLVDAVQAGRAYVSKIPQETPGASFDVSSVILGNMVFAPDVTTNDEPTEVVETLSSGSENVCAFWDYAGMQDGVTWDAVWYVDGQLDEDHSVLNDTWSGGETGNWWVCLRNEQGVSDGLYEVIISINSEARGSNTIFVGGDHPAVQFTIENTSDTPICYAYISPTGAQNWGFDKFGPNEGADAGSTATLTIPAGQYDLLLQDCDGADAVEEHDLEIADDTVYRVPNQ